MNYLLYLIGKRKNEEAKRWPTSDFLPAITTWEPIGIKSQVAVSAYRTHPGRGFDVEYPDFQHLA